MVEKLEMEEDRTSEDSSDSETDDGMEDEPKMEAPAEPKPLSEMELLSDEARKLLGFLKRQNAAADDILKYFHSEDAGVGWNQQRKAGRSKPNNPETPPRSAELSSGSEAEDMDEDLW